MGMNKAALGTILGTAVLGLAKNKGSKSLSIPRKLYHATYGPLVDSIMKQGLGGDRDTVYEDSVRGVVYLAVEPYIAESYAEVGLDHDHVWNRFKDTEIVIFEIDTSSLDPKLFMIDRNVLDNDGSTLEYHGVIPSSVIRIFSRGSLALDDFDDENKGGDCFEAAGRWMTNHPGTDAVLVHGEVMGRGALQGVWFGHAWIEQGDEVIEVAGGKNARLPKNIYYILGNIDQPYYQDGKMNPPKNNVLKYTYPETIQKLADNKNWGPWELETETGY